MNYFFINNKTVIIFLSLFLINCRGGAEGDSNGSNIKPQEYMSQEVCKNKQKCSSARYCVSSNKLCIKGLCENPICISSVDACKAACGYSNCIIKESDPSSVSCQQH